MAPCSRAQSIHTACYIFKSMGSCAILVKKIFPFKLYKRLKDDWLKELFETLAVMVTHERKSIWKVNGLAGHGDVWKDMEGKVSGRLVVWKDMGQEVLVVW